jgi:hypothetical protein
MAPFRKCFVIMPFSGVPGLATKREWTRIYETLIKPAVEDARQNLVCERSRPLRGNIIKEIISDLCRADVVIADLSGKNSNVFYELGVRHVIKGKTILISQRREDIPSDLHNYARFIYDPHTPQGRKAFKSKIKELLEDVVKKPLRTDNPIEDFGREYIHLSRPPDYHTDLQNAAQKVQSKNYIATLNGIARGQLPIEGGTAGYFNHFCNVINKNTKPEHVMVFPRLLAFEVRKGFKHFGPCDLFNRLKSLVDSKKMTIEYTVFFGSAKTMKAHGGEQLLKEYSKFSTEVRFVLQSTANLPPHDVERTICLLTKHKWAFTHGWDNDGNITNPTHWCFGSDYDSFDNTYQRIRFHSKLFFKK